MSTSSSSHLAAGSRSAADEFFFWLRNRRRWRCCSLWRRLSGFGTDFSWVFSAAALIRGQRRKKSCRWSQGRATVWLGQFIGRRVQMQIFVRFNRIRQLLMNQKVDFSLTESDCVILSDGFICISAALTDARFFSECSGRSVHWMDSDPKEFM